MQAKYKKVMKDEDKQYMEDATGKCESLHDKI